MLKLRIGTAVLVLAEPSDQDGRPAAVNPATTAWSAAGAPVTVTETADNPLLAVVSPQAPGSTAVLFAAQSELGQALSAELAVQVLDAVTFTFRLEGSWEDVSVVRLTRDLEPDPWQQEVVATARDETGAQAMLAPGVPIDDITWSIGPEDPPVIQVLTSLASHVVIRGLRAGTTTLKATALNVGGQSFAGVVPVVVVGAVSVALRPNKLTRD